jgi:hypothetical protein
MFIILSVVAIKVFHPHLQCRWGCLCCELWYLCKYQVHLVYDGQNLKNHREMRPCHWKAPVGWLFNVISLSLSLSLSPRPSPPSVSMSSNVPAFPDHQGLEGPEARAPERSEPALPLRAAVRVLACKVFRFFQRHRLRLRNLNKTSKVMGIRTSRSRIPMAKSGPAPEGRVAVVCFEECMQIAIFDVSPRHSVLAGGYPDQREEKQFLTQLRSFLGNLMLLAN